MLMRNALNWAVSLGFSKKLKMSRMGPCFPRQVLDTLPPDGPRRRGDPRPPGLRGRAAYSKSDADLQHTGRAELRRGERDASEGRLTAAEAGRGSVPGLARSRREVAAATHRRGVG